MSSKAVGKGPTRECRRKGKLRLCCCSAPRVRTVDQLDQRYLLVPEKVKDAYLVHLVQTFQDQMEDCSIIIFTNTCK